MSVPNVEIEDNSLIIHCPRCGSADCGHFNKISVATRKVEDGPALMVTLNAAKENMMAEWESN